MTDEFHRVDIEIDGEEKRIKISSADAIRMLQPHWLGDVEKGWQLISSNLDHRLPALIAEGIQKHEDAKERERQKIIEEYKAANPEQKIKDQVTDMASGRYGWAIGMLGLGLLIFGIALIFNLPIVQRMMGV